MTERPNKRRYDDGCAAAHALELIGERWALLVVRELALGPKRFTDLRADLPGIGPNVLTQRLDDLAAAAILRQRRLAPPAAGRVYELTAWGRELEPILRDLGRWGARSPTKPAGRPLSINSLILSLRTMFDPARAGDFATTLELRFGGHVFAAVLADGVLTVEPGPAAAPEVVVEGDHNGLAAVVYGGADLAETLHTGALTVTGDVAALARFVRLFPLPPPAAAAEGGAGD